MRNIFTEHPRSVNETYFQHQQFALKCSFQMIGAGFACLVHAFFPFLFEHTASSSLKDLTIKMVDRGLISFSDVEKPKS